MVNGNGATGSFASCNFMEPGELKLDNRLAFNNICNLIETMEENEQNYQVLKQIASETLRQIKMRQNGMKSQPQTMHQNSLKNKLQNNLQRRNETVFSNSNTILHSSLRNDLSHTLLPDSQETCDDNISIQREFPGERELTRIESEEEEEEEVDSLSTVSSVQDGNDSAHVLRKWSIKKDKNNLFLCGVKMDRKGNLVDKYFVSKKVISRPESDLVRTQDGDFILQEHLSDPDQNIPEEVKKFFEVEVFPKFWRKVLATWNDIEEKTSKKKGKQQKKADQENLNPKNGAKNKGANKSQVELKNTMKNESAAKSQETQQKPRKSFTKESKDTPREGKSTLKEGKSTPKERKNTPKETNASNDKTKKKENAEKESTKPSKNKETLQKPRKGTPKETKDTPKEGKSIAKEGKGTPKETKPSNDKTKKKGNTEKHSNPKNKGASKKKDVEPEEDEDFNDQLLELADIGDDESMFLLPSSSFTPTGLSSSLTKTVIKGRFTPPTQVFDNIYGTSTTPLSNASTFDESFDAAANKNVNVVKRMIKAKKAPKVPERPPTMSKALSKQNAIVEEVLRAANAQTTTTPTILKEVFRNKISENTDDESETDSF